MPDTGAPHNLPWPPSTGVTPDVPRDMQALAEQIALRLSRITTVTSLPGSPVNEQRTDLLVDSGGTQGGPYVWPLTYRTASTAWLPVGANAILIEPADETLSGSTSGTATGTLTIPADGDYEIAFGAAVTVAPPSSSTGVIALVRLNGVDDAASQVRFTSSTARVRTHNVMRRTLAAGDTLEIRCINGETGTRDFVSLSLSARPISLD